MRKEAKKKKQEKNLKEKRRKEEIEKKNRAFLREHSDLVSCLYKFSEKIFACVNIMLGPKNTLNEWMLFTVFNIFSALTTDI